MLWGVVRRGRVLTVVVVVLTVDTLGFTVMQQLQAILPAMAEVQRTSSLAVKAPQGIGLLKRSEAAEGTRPYLEERQCSRYFAARVRHGRMTLPPPPDYKSIRKAHPMRVKRTWRAVAQQH
jgi:hypothetical protein